MARQITCVVPDAEKPNSRIECLGGNGWTKREATVIAEIEAGCSYFVDVDGAPIRVIVAERAGRKYLRTNPDQTVENNLLALPNCP